MAAADDLQAHYWAERRGSEDLEHIVRFVTTTGAHITQDGNQWCYLLGEDLQVGVAGFGDTPMAAAEAFYSAFRSERIRHAR